jgi:hypothetical protein
MAGNKNSGRPKGVLNQKKSKIRPSVTVKRIVVDSDKRIGEQLKPYRLFYGYTLKEFEELSGLELTLICHFENGTGPMASKGWQWGETSRKYLKALGIKEITIKL